jgi:hypothetical protein
MFGIILLAVNTLSCKVSARPCVDVVYASMATLMKPEIKYAHADDLVFEHAASNRCAVGDVVPCTITMLEA